MVQKLEKGQISVINFILGEFGYIAMFMDTEGSQRLRQRRDLLRGWKPESW
jgi:hypothetical protein